MLLASSCTARPWIRRLRCSAVIALFRGTEARKVYSSTALFGPWCLRFLADSSRVPRLSLRLRGLAQLRSGGLRDSPSLAR